VGLCLEPYGGPRERGVSDERGTPLVPPTTRWPTRVSSGPDSGVLRDHHKALKSIVHPIRP
jgi:hypothetical protein